jgi:hypothetical protein
MGRLAVGTVVAKNFLSFARVLARSFREHHPEVPFFVVLADQVDGVFDPDAEAFEIVPLDALRIPDVRRLCFRYSRLQLSAAAKPHFLRYLLDRGFTSAVFLDADVLVLGRLDPLLDATAAHAVALTPHLLGPLLGQDAIARELNILQSGTYNGGFIGVSSSSSARRFLSWWENRLRTHCRHDVRGGMHNDQRWLDLVPATFDEVCIVRDAGCNVAYWNLPERDVDASCRFFHFSGFEPLRPEAVTKYSPRLATESIGPAAVLFDRYARLLEDEGHSLTRSWPYAFGFFDNGVPIPHVARLVYQELDDTDAAAFGDPFQTGERHSYFRWLNEPAKRNDGPRSATPRLWAAVYRSRPDLQRAFPDILGEDRLAFQNWILTSGLREHEIPAAFAPPVTQD